MRHQLLATQFIAASAIITLNTSKIITPAINFHCQQQLIRRGVGFRRFGSTSTAAGNNSSSNIGLGKSCSALYPSSNQRPTSFAPSFNPCYLNKNRHPRSDLKLNNKKNMSTSATTQSPNADDAIKLLRQQKQSLRKQIRSRIKTTYPPTEESSTNNLVTQSNLVFSRLFSLPQYKSAKSIGFFLSMPKGEIQTRTAIQQIVQQDGKSLYVPRVGLDFEKCDMDLIRCDTTTSSSSTTKEGVLFYDSWPKNKWGIPEPPVIDTDTNVAKPGDIDLLIVPGLSFDTHGHRLGQGKGYYDRFIAKMRHEDESGNDINNKEGTDDSEKKPLLVGVCLEEQFSEDVPHGVDLGVREDGKGGIIPVSDHDYIMDMVLTPSRTLVVSKE